MHRLRCWHLFDQHWRIDLFLVRWLFSWDIPDYQWCVFLDRVRRLSCWKFPCNYRRICRDRMFQLPCRNLLTDDWGEQFRSMRRLLCWHLRSDFGVVCISRLCWLSRWYVPANNRGYFFYCMHGMRGGLVPKHIGGNSLR